MSRIRCSFYNILLLILFFSLNVYSQQTDSLTSPFIFSMSLEELMNIKVVTASKKEEKITDIPASAVIITRADIELYGFSTLAEILENIPGMYKINDYSWDGHDKFGVRGFWSDITNNNIKIFVNGINQQDDIHNNFPLDKIAVPVEAIDRIEIIRGPMSVVYGSGAFFGVINIITNKYIGTGYNQVSASAGSHNARKLTLKATGKEGKFMYAINGGLYSSSGIAHPYSKMMSNSAAAEMPTMGTDNLLEIDEKYISFAGDFKNFYVDFSYIETNNEFYLIEPSFKEGSISKYITGNSVIGYRNNFSDKLSIDTKFAYHSTNHKLDYDFYFENSYNYQVLQGQAFEFDLNTFITPSKNIDITLGLNYRSAKNLQSRIHIPSSGWGDLYNITSETSPGEKIITRGIFGQLIYKPFEKLQLIGGLRLEQMPEYDLRRVDATDSLGVPPVIDKGKYSYEGISFIPRFAAIYRLLDHNVIKFLYGKAINRPSFWHIHAQLVFGQPGLEPEEIQTFEINYLAAFSSYFSLNASLFYNILDNLIVRDHGLDEDGTYYDIEKNSGKKNTFGGEIMLQFRPNPDFYFEFSGTYQKTEDSQHDIEPGYSPNFLAYIKSYYQISNNLTFSITGNYVDAMEAYWAPNPDGTGQRISNETFSGYFTLGGNIRINNILNKGVFVNMRCSNLLNSEIRYPTYNNNRLFTKGTLGLDRSILISLGVKF